MNFLLLQINDSSFPIGSYTHSFGLETYIQQGIINNKEDSIKYIKSILNSQILYTDLLLIKLVYEAKELDEVIKLEKIVNVSTPAKETRDGMKKIGTRFIKAIQSMQLGSNYMFDLYVANSIYKIHASAYAMLCKTQNIESSIAIKHYLYSQTSNITTNCVKLIPLSQYDGQSILALSHIELIRVYDKLQTLNINDFCNTSANNDIKSMQHEVLHSRLYMS